MRWVCQSHLSLSSLWMVVLGPKKKVTPILFCFLHLPRLVSGNNNCYSLSIVPPHLWARNTSIFTFGWLFFVGHPVASSPIWTWPKPVLNDNSIVHFVVATWLHSVLTPSNPVTFHSLICWVTMEFIRSVPNNFRIDSTLQMTRIIMWQISREK